MDAAFAGRDRRRAGPVAAHRPAGAGGYPRDQAARDDRGEPGPRAGFEGSTWFRINAGRRHNADPRWLLPLICRYGHVGRNDIGAIRVAANESYFEVTAARDAGLHQGAAPRDDRAGGRGTGDRAGPAARNRGRAAFQAPSDGAPRRQEKMASQEAKEEVRLDRPGPKGARRGTEYQYRGNARV